MVIEIRPVIPALEDWPVAPEEETPITRELRECYEYLALPHGWIKGHEETYLDIYEMTAYCSIGILGAFTNEYEDYDLATLLVVQAIRELHPTVFKRIIQYPDDGWYDSRNFAQHLGQCSTFENIIVNFNDDDKRRKADVVEVFKRAVELSKELK